MKPSKPSKASAFAKAHRDLKPKPLWLQYDEMLGARRNHNGVWFGVSGWGQLTIDGTSFAAKDALRLARWIEENFR
jgi:hypothetical protein